MQNLRLKVFKLFTIFLVFIGIINCYIDRSALSYAINPLCEYFHLSNQMFGFLSSIFAVGYICTVFIGGVLVDKFGARMVWGFSAFIWSISTFLVGSWSSTFFILGSLRFILGAAEGPSFPAVSKVSTVWLSSANRVKTLAISLAAVPLASAIGAPVVSNLIYHFGWRVMFICLGVFGAIWSVLWLWLYKDKNPETNSINTKSVNNSQDHKRVVHSSRHLWLRILFNRVFLINNFAYFSFGYTLFFGIAWLPGYLSQSFHLNIKSIGVILILPWLLSALAILACGWLSDYLWGRTKSLRISRSLVIAFSMVAASILFIPTVLTQNLNTAIIFMSLALSCALFPNSCFYALNADLAKDNVATGLGVMSTFFALSGIIAPSLTGYVTNYTHNFKAAILVMIGLNLLSGILILAFQKPDDPNNLII
jgi:MFS transporter, ACS family, hexuronate transporter